MYSELTYGKGSVEAEFHIDRRVEQGRKRKLEVVFEWRARIGKAEVDGAVQPARKADVHLTRERRDEAVLWAVERSVEQRQAGGCEVERVDGPVDRVQLVPRFEGAP